MKIERSREAWLKRLAGEADCSVAAGVPTEEDCLWTIQQLAAIGLEATDETGPLAEVFATIHRVAARRLASPNPCQNEAAK